MFTEDGFALGTVEDLEFDSTDGTVRAVITSTERIEGSRLLGLGSYAVMVSSPERSSAAHRNGDRDTGAPSTDELDGLTRADLYEMAQERDISGRSKMKKAELVRALS